MGSTLVDALRAVPDSRHRRGHDIPGGEAYLHHRDPDQWPSAVMPLTPSAHDASSVSLPDIPIALTATAPERTCWRRASYAQPRMAVWDTIGKTRNAAGPRSENDLSDTLDYYTPRGYSTMTADTQLGYLGRLNRSRIE